MDRRDDDKTPQSTTYHPHATKPATHDTNLVDNGLVVLRREHEVYDGPHHSRLRARMPPGQQGVQRVLLLQDIVHLTVPVHESDAHDTPLLHVCSEQTNVTEPNRQMACLFSQLRNGAQEPWECVT